MTGPPPGVPAPSDPPAADDIARWHRLHPLSPLVRAGRHLMGIGIVVILLLFANQRGSQAGNDLIIDLVVIALVLGAGVVSWLVTRWQVADGVLRIETGLVRRQSRRFPLSQVQAIDVVQTGLARVLGLAERAPTPPAAVWPACGWPTRNSFASGCCRWPVRPRPRPPPRPHATRSARRGRRVRPPRPSGRCSGSGPSAWSAPSH